MIWKVVALYRVIISYQADTSACFGATTTEMRGGIFIPKRRDVVSNFTLPNHLKKYLDYICPHCFVYFISDGENTKIGIAKNLIKRLEALQVGNPKKLKIVSFAPCATENSAREIEKYLHKSLDCCRLEGEWFKLPASVFTRLFLDFVVDYDDWRICQYETERRKQYKRKYLNV